MEQVRANTADLAEVLEGQGLAGRIAMSSHQREGEDGRVVLGRTAAVADFHDPIHGADAVGLDAADQRVVVLVHQIALGDVVGAALGAEGQEPVQAGPVMHSLW